MLDYIVKFNKLPEELRDEVSTPEVMRAIDELEDRYRVGLATLVMRVMAKEILFGSLADYFVEEEGLDRMSAEQLKVELAGRVFLKVADYLGIDLEEILAGAPEPTPEGADLMTVSRTAGAEVQTVRPAGGVRGAQFFFSPDDEEEIRKLSENLGRPPEVNNKLVEERLGKILEKANIHFGSEAVAERFKQILRIYLKNIRNRLDTKLTMAKTFEAGGLNFAEESAENILALADKSEALLKEEKMKPPARIPVPEDKLAGQAGKLASFKSIGASDLEYDLAKEMEKRQQARRDLPPGGPGGQAKAEAAKNAPAAAADKPAATLPAPSVPVAEPVPVPPKTAAPAATPPPAEPERISIKRPLETAGGKKKMEDIKYVPKTTGPIAELEQMDITSFRRIDKEPAAIVSKIKEKIKLLEDEQYSKRSEAIKAWRISPVNKLYLSIGEEAIAQNKPIDIIIEERKSRQEDYLSDEEFEAIMDLNRELRF